MQGVQLQANHPLVSLATKNQPAVRSPTKTHLYRVQLQTNYPVERSGRRIHLVDSSATKKPPCREFSCKQITQ